MSARQELHVVTGAYGYSGKYIAHRLLECGYEVRTLTNSPHRDNPFGDSVAAFPFNFEQPDQLRQSLEGVTVLYNTYWVRFNHRLFTHAEAVRNTLTLFDAARKAGVERIVHVSITNPEAASNLEYFVGKAQLERALVDSGMSHAILRPAVLFGKEDVLINNIAWTLRHLPVFGVFGNGSYGIQPIYVDDLAELAVTQGARRENVIINAVGPETFTFRELVETIGRLIDKERPVIGLPPHLAYWATQIVGLFVDDVFLTWEEVQGLMAGTLAVDAPPAGKTALTDWVRANAATLGWTYTSELARRRDRRGEYRSN